MHRVHQLNRCEAAFAIRSRTREDHAAPDIRGVFAAPATAERWDQEGAQHRAIAFHDRVGAFFCSATIDEPLRRAEEWDRKEYRKVREENGDHGPGNLRNDVRS